MNDIKSIHKRISDTLKDISITPAHTEYKHVYALKFKGGPEIRLDSVTTISGILGKGYLKQWAVNQGIDHLREVLSPGMDTFALADALTTAGTKHRDALQEAARIGTEIHDRVERYLNGVIAGEENAEDYLKDSSESPVLSGCLAAKKFLADHKVEPVASELLVASTVLSTAGTLDLLAYVDGRLSIVDWKSSNSIDKPEYLMQVSAYEKALLETFNIRVYDVYIVQLSKKDGNYTVAKIDEGQRKSALKTFEHTCKIYEWLESSDARIEKPKKRVLEI